MRPVREQYYRAWRLARVEDRMVYPFAGVVLEPRRGAVRPGPNARAYALSVIMKGLDGVRRSTDKAKGLRFELGALRHARDARTWESWATLP